MNAFLLHKTNIESTPENKPLDTANIPNGLVYAEIGSVLSFLFE